MTAFTGEAVEMQQSAGTLGSKFYRLTGYERTGKSNGTKLILITKVLDVF